MTEEKHAAPAGGDKPANWLTAAETAAMIGVSSDTLRSYRTPSKRRGPPFHKNGYHVVYLREEVEAFIASTGRRALVTGG